MFRLHWAIIRWVKLACGNCCVLICSWYGPCVIYFVLEVTTSLRCAVLLQYCDCSKRCTKDWTICENEYITTLFQLQRLYRAEWDGITWYNDWWEGTHLEGGSRGVFHDICMERLRKITENELTTSRVEKGTSGIKTLRLDYSALRWIICRTEFRTTYRLYRSVMLRIVIDIKVVPSRNTVRQCTQCNLHFISLIYMFRLY
jgi:hypothetical protein